MGKFVIKKRTNGDYQFDLHAGNGENILTSQGYSTKSSCENGVASVRTNAVDSSKFDRTDASNGKFYFNLKAANGLIIGTSQMYASASGRDHGISSVSTNAPNAEVNFTS